MLFALLKAPLAGFLMTLVFAAIIHMLEGNGTFLMVHDVVISDIRIAWSWPLFLGMTVLSFAVIWMTD